MSVHEFTSRVRYSECGESGRLTLNGVVNYFQDVSSFHGEDCGIGINYLQENHLSWLLSFWQIFTDSYPLLGNIVTAQTWAYGFKGFYGLRNFALRDDEGKMSAWANSVWVLMDTTLHRPVKIPDKMVEIYSIEPPLPMDYAPRKIPEPEDGQEMPPFTVDRHQLDTNHHVNNSQYIAMAEDYLPEGFDIYETRVEYKAEAHAFDRVTPVISEHSGDITVALKRNDGKNYAIVRFLSRR